VSAAKVNLKNQRKRRLITEEEKGEKELAKVSMKKVIRTS
jgi:hypothetical protein